MRTFKKFAAVATSIILICAVTTLQSCGDDEPDYINATSMVSLGSAAGSSSMVSVNANCAWTVSGTPSWFTVSPESGYGNGSIVVTAVEDNNTGNDRSGTYYNFKRRHDNDSDHNTEVGLRLYF